MTSQQKQAIIDEQNANWRNHQANMTAEQNSHQQRINVFEENLIVQQAKIEATQEQWRELAEGYMQKIQEVKRTHDELIKRMIDENCELLKKDIENESGDLEMLKLEAGRGVSLASEHAAELSKHMDTRVQEAKVIQEKVRMEREQTLKMAEICNKARQKQEEHIIRVEQENEDALGKIHSEKLENEKQEQKRIENHEEINRSIDVLGAESKAGMLVAETKMNSIRDAQNQLSKISDNIVVLQKDFHDIVLIVNSAHELKNPGFLKMQALFIDRQVQATITNRNLIELKLVELQKQDIDEHNVTRKDLIDRVIEDLKKLDSALTILSMLTPTKTKTVDRTVLDQFFGAVQNADRTILSISTLWKDVPPITRTNFVQAQFLDTTAKLTRILKLEEKKVSSIAN